MLPTAVAMAEAFKKPLREIELIRQLSFFLLFGKMVVRLGRRCNAEANSRS
jgi:hypothetical protein